MAWKYYYAGRAADQPAYGQFPHGKCSVGCGPVAWAILFAWADRQAHNGNEYWEGRHGLYRFNGGRDDISAVAPIVQDQGVNNMIREIRGHVRTYCWDHQGATNPWWMQRADRYIKGRSDTRVSTHYNSLGIHKDRLAKRATESIVHRRTPVVIGTGFLEHYPVAWGYAWRTRIVKNSKQQTDTIFRLNSGWGGGGKGEWIDASTWFAGEIYP